MTDATFWAEKPISCQDFWKNEPKFMNLKNQILIGNQTIAYFNSCQVLKRDKFM